MKPTIMSGFLASVLILLLSACTNELQREDVGLSDNRQPLFFKGCVLSRSFEENWNSNQLISIIIKEPGTVLSSSSIIDYMENKRYRFDKNQNLFVPASSQDTVFVSSKKEFGAIAYSPALTVSRDYTVAINVLNQKDLSAVDFLYSKNLDRVRLDKEPLALNFVHQLAKVKLCIEVGDGLSEEDMKGMKAILCDVPVDGIFSLATGELEVGDELMNIEMNVSENGLEAEAVLLPCETEHAVILITRTGDQYTCYLDERRWEPANQYEYQLAIAKDCGMVSFVAQVTPWIVNETIRVDQGSAVHSVDGWDGKTVDVAWYQEALSTFDLYTASEFAGLAKLVEEGYTMKDKTIRLRRDLDMRNHIWKPIGYATSTVFEGTFNGGNHTIFNLNENELDASRGCGLFVENKGIIKNLGLRGRMVLNFESVPDNLSKVYYGSFAGKNSGLIQNCMSFQDVVTDKQILDCQYIIGGICGQNMGEVISCVNYGVVEFGGSATYAKRVILGGIVGWNYQKVEGCDNYQVVGVSSGVGIVGGVVGYVDGGSRILNCSNSGTVSSCINSNVVSSSSNAVGGVCGGSFGTQNLKNTIEGCLNEAGVTASYPGGVSYAGGIVGYVHEWTDVKSCVNDAKGIIRCDTRSVGGIVGQINSSATGVHVYSDGRNDGWPAKWIGSDLSASDKGGVMEP